MKKYIKYILVFIMVFSLSAYKTTDEKAIKKASNTFLTTIKKGDLNKAQTLCNNDVSKVLAIDNREALIKKQFLTLLNSDSDKMKKVINDFIDEVLKKYYKSYKLKNDYDDENKTITISLTEVDTLTLSSMQKKINNKISALSMKYITKNQAQLIKVNKQNSFKGMQKDIDDNIASSVKKILKSEYLDKLEYKTTNIKLTFKNKNNKWTVIKAQKK